MNVEQMKILIQTETEQFIANRDVRACAMADLVIFLNKLVDFAYDLYFDDDTTVDTQHVLFNVAPNLGKNYIEIENIFQLYYILDIELFAMVRDDGYVISCNYKDSQMAEIVSADVYNAIYKDISTLIVEQEVFNPYNH